MQGTLTLNMPLSFISRSRMVLHYAAVLLTITASPVCFGQQAAPREMSVTSVQERQIGATARKVYSTFDSARINSLSCEGAVDWETLLKGRIGPGFREDVLPVLKGTRFLVTLEKDGTVRISTRATVLPPSQDAEDRANGSIRSFGGVIATVLEGWARFAMNADLPATTDAYQLDKAGDHYLVAFRNGPADVAVTMDRSFMMSEERTETTDGPMLTHPKFMAAAGGYLVTSWQMVFPRGQGSDLSVEARYMQVEGVEVPAAMTLHSSLPSFGEITLPLVLTNYQFQR